MKLDDCWSHLIVQVAKAIKIVLKSSQPYIVVKLDIERIEALHMRISSQSVQQAILNHPKTKLKPEVWRILTLDPCNHSFYVVLGLHHAACLQHIRVLGNNKLKIYPPEADRSKLQFELHSLKAVLPKVIVKVELMFPPLEIQF